MATLSEHIIGSKDPMVPEPYRVRSVRRETADTVTLDLKPGEGTRPMTFEPGQFNMLYVMGQGEVPISISGAPDENSRLLHTVRAVGSVTNRICSLRAGDTIGVRGPFGTSWPVTTAEGADVLIVAGGIGLAPLRPALYHVLAHRERYGRVIVLYGARRPQEMLFRRELEAWRGRFDAQVRVTVDNAGSDWYGHVGVVTTLIPFARYDPEDTVAMVCGPEIMMRFAVMELLSQGVPKPNIYLSFERNMKCAIGLCGHCQFGPEFVCKDGPVFSFSRAEALMKVREL